MNVGMMWFDSEREQPMESRVARAADYYRGKYGRSPTLCFVHPSTAEGTLPAQVGNLELRPMPEVLPNHFWLGVRPVEEDTDPG